jgi:hypothetical protein
MFSVHMGTFFHGYDIRLCFLAIWPNFTMVKVSGRLCFLSLWGIFSMDMMSGSCVFCPYGGMFSWICYKTVFSVDLGQFYHGNNVRGLCFFVPFFHGYDIGLCFWQFGPILPRNNYVRGLSFLSIWGNIFNGYDIRRCFQ